jgi:hypothetical protein
MKECIFMAIFSLVLIVKMVILRMMKRMTTIFVNVIRRAVTFLAKYYRASLHFTALVGERIKICVNASAYSTLIRKRKRKSRKGLNFPSNKIENSEAKVTF